MTSDSVTCTMFNSQKATGTLVGITNNKQSLSQGLGGCFLLRCLFTYCLSFYYTILTRGRCFCMQSCIMQWYQGENEMNFSNAKSNEFV